MVFQLLFSISCKIIRLAVFLASGAACMKLVLFINLDRIYRINRIILF